VARSRACRERSLATRSRSHRAGLASPALELPPRVARHRGRALSTICSSHGRHDEISRRAPLMRPDGMAWALPRTSCGTDIPVYAVAPVAQTGISVPRDEGHAPHQFVGAHSSSRRPRRDLEGARRVGRYARPSGPRGPRMTHTLYQWEGDDATSSDGA
jgi:hypothetical protein